MRRRRLRLAGRLLAGAGLLLLPALAGAVEVVLEPERDATLFLDASGATASGSGPGLFAGNNSAENTRRGLLRFDVAAAIPAGATIEAVTLRLHVDSAPVEDTVTVTLHRVLASWGEGASAAGGGQPAQAEPGDATWLHRFYPDSLWSAPGGDFDPGTAASAEVGFEGEATWAGPDLTILVQAWLDDPATNHGALLRGEEDRVSTVRRFDSREVATAGFRPALVITYSPVPVERLSWGAVKRTFAAP